jgi:hypothetical protein
LLFLCCLFFCSHMSGLGQVEDLYALLSAVKARQPEVEAVSCGAILSTYQRTRVENVCGYITLRHQLHRLILLMFRLAPVSIFILQAARFGFLGLLVAA